MGILVGSGDYYNGFKGAPDDYTGTRRHITTTVGRWTNYPLVRLCDQLTGSQAYR
jgi:hypothetical protein